MPKNVFDLIDDLIAGLQQLKDSLAPLSALTGQSAAAAAEKAAPAPKPAAAAPRAPRKPRVARKPVAAVAVAAKPAPAAAPSNARALQGKYMAAVRVLSKDKQDVVRRVREEQGVEAAIAYARSLKG